MTTVVLSTFVLASETFELIDERSSTACCCVRHVRVAHSNIPFHLSAE